MPSSPGYVRDHKRERETQIQRGEHIDNRKRKQARRDATKLGMVKPNDGKDLDHKVPLSKGGSNKPSNFRAVSPSKNRAFPRNPDGSMK